MGIEGKKQFPKEKRRYLGPAVMKDWEEIIETREQAESRFRELERHLKECGVQLDESSRVLELGSGKGKMLEIFVEKDIQAIGTDIRPRGSSELPQVQAHIEQLPFANDTFDLIYSNSIFDRGLYRQDHSLMIAEIVRVLKQGGVYNASFEMVTSTIPRALKRISNPKYKELFEIYRKV